jgi:hypothetical protein
MGSCADVFLGAYRRYHSEEEHCAIIPECAEQEMEPKVSTVCAVGILSSFFEM